MGKETEKSASDDGSLAPKTKQPAFARRLLGVFGSTVAWALVATGLVAYAGGRWIVKTFGYITPDMLMMNMQGAGGEGVGGADVVRSGIINIVIVPLGICLGLLLIWVSLRVILGRNTPADRQGRRLSVALLTVLAVLMPAFGAFSLGSAVQVREYLASRDPNLDVGDYYVPPELTSPDATPRYNLVLIYMESIEEQLANDEVLSQDLLHSLEQVTGDWERIPYLEQYKNFGWTMAGIVGTQCGVPLRAPSSSQIDLTADNDGGILNAWSEANYLDPTVCLGDVLSVLGYKNVFMGAAYAAFAGKGTFLEHHGYSEVLTREHWDQYEDVPTPMDWWGISDGTLMDLAKKEALDLRADGQPFNLTVLTVDTHEPAYSQDYCPIVTDLAMESVVMCSVEQVADFLEFLEDHGFMDDTVVIVMGDHLRMAGPLDDKLSGITQRGIFNRIHTPDGREVRVETADQFALYPTILEALGFELRDDRAGLGVSAFTPDVKYGTLRSVSDDERRRLIASRSQDFYDSLWGLNPNAGHEAQPGEEEPQSETPQSEAVAEQLELEDRVIQAEQTEGE